MTADEAILDRVRKEFAKVAAVEEKRMFGGVAFLVNGKLCVSVGRQGIMCRIDPSLQPEVIGTNGCKPVIMKGRVYRGYVRVDRAVIRERADLRRWMDLSLDFNNTIAEKNSIAPLRKNKRTGKSKKAPD